MSKVTAIIAFFSLSFLSSVFSADETITITTYYPSPTGSYRQLRANMMVVSPTRAMPTTDGTLAWGNGQANLHADQGGSMELGGLNGGSFSTPYIDFHRDNTPFPTNDYDARIILTAANELQIIANLTVTGRVNTSSCVDYTVGTISSCPAYSYVVGCGVGSCASRAALSSPAACNQSGYIICVKY